MVKIKSFDVGSGDTLLKGYRSLRQCMPRVVLIPHHGAKPDCENSHCKEIHRNHCRLAETRRSSSSTAGRSMTSIFDDVVRKNIGKTA